MGGAILSLREQLSSLEGEISDEDVDELVVRGSGRAVRAGIDQLREDLKQLDGLRLKDEGKAEK